MATPEDMPVSPSGATPGRATTAKHYRAGSPEMGELGEMGAVAQQRRYRLDGIGPRRQAFDRALVGTLEALDGWFRRHWLATANTVIGVFIGLAVVAPILRGFGLVGFDQAMLSTYHIFCAQTPTHSLYLGGHQICLCERCMAIYSSLLLGGLLLALFRSLGRRVAPLDWRWWIVAMLPMALDGGTQLFGWRESNLGLRFLTGAIFGLATAWFGLPQIQDAALDAPAVAPAVAPIQRR